MNAKNTLKIVQGPIGYLVVGAIVFGVAYWLFAKIKKKGGDLTQPFSNFIGDAISWVKLPGAVSSSGNIRLPNGNVISLNTIVKGSGIDDNNRFSYGGISYTLGPRGADGIYTAS